MILALDLYIQLVVSWNATFPSVSAVAAFFDSHKYLLHVNGEPLIKRDFENAVLRAGFTAFEHAASRINVDSFLLIEIFPSVDEHQRDQTGGAEINVGIRQPIRFTFELS